MKILGLKNVILFALFYFIHLIAIAQKFASWNGQVVVLDNGFVKKELVISNDTRRCSIFGKTHRCWETVSAPLIRW